MTVLTLIQLVCHKHIQPVKIPLLYISVEAEHIHNCKIALLAGNVQSYITSKSLLCSDADQMKLNSHIAVLLLK